MNTELTESQINGRFRVLDRPAALPGKCAVCGNVERPVLDFGLDLDFYGAVVICLECVTSAAEIVGLVPRERLDVAQLVQLNHNYEIQKAGQVVHDFYNELAVLYGKFA